MEEFVQTITKVFREEIRIALVPINESLAELKLKFDRLESRVDSLEAKVNKLESEVAKLKSEVAELKSNVAELKSEVDELKSEVDELKKSVFIIEHEHGKKIDAIYDLVYLNNEINEPKFNQIPEISKKVDINSLKILNHETRISNLEKV